MKKYITVAALLAAGTAFANAATSLAEAIAETPYDGTASFELELTFDSASLANGTGSILSLKDGFSFYYSNGYLGFDSAGGTALPDDVANQYLEGTWGYDPSGTYADYGLGESLSTCISVDKDLNKVQVNGDVKLALAYTMFSSEFSSWAVTVDYNDDSSCRIIGYTVVNANDLTVGASYTAGIFTAHKTHEDEAGGFYTENIPVEFAPSPSIPEPSTFGLLAGIGALALVASRRRRK